MDFIQLSNERDGRTKTQTNKQTQALYIIRRVFCPTHYLGGFCQRGYCHRGVLSEGFTTEGVLTRGVLDEYRLNGYSSSSSIRKAKNPASLLRNVEMSDIFPLDKDNFGLPGGILSKYLLLSGVCQFDTKSCTKTLAHSD